MDNIEIKISKPLSVATINSLLIVANGQNTSLNKYTIFKTKIKFKWNAKLNNHASVANKLESILNQK